MNKCDFIDGKTQLQKKLMKETIDLGLNFINGKIRNHKVLNYKSPDFFKKLLDQPLPESKKSYKDCLSLLKTIGKYSISQSDLNYIAFPDAGNSFSGMMGEIFSKFLNQNLVAFDRSAPIATIIEIQLIEWLRQLIGYEYKPLVKIMSLSEVSGMWTTGGHMSNHIAILTALNFKYKDLKTNGLTSLNTLPKIIVAGNISHYSIASAVHHLGLGTNSIINCQASSNYTTDCNCLEKILESRKKEDDIFMVIGVAGNTRTSNIDNLEKIAKICQKHNIWFHVDACHGGSLLFSQKKKQRYLKGIELADSVSLDPHKGMFVTYPSSYVLFKRRDALVKFTRYETQVRDGTVWDLGYITPFFGSRGFESLKFWLLIKSMGIKKLGQIVDKRHDNAIYVAKLIERTGLFSVFNTMDFYRMAFVFYPQEVCELVEASSRPKIKKEVKKCVDFYTHKINQKLYEEGKVCLDEFKLHDLNNSTDLEAGEDRFSVMSVTIGNPLFTTKSLKKTLGYFFEVSKKFVKPMKKDVLKIIHGDNSAINTENKIYGPAGWK